MNDNNFDVSTRGPSSIIRPIKDKVRAQVRSKRIRMQEFFANFDTHNSKKVSVPQFARALNMAGINLSPREIDLLCQRYADPRGDVEYYRFCDQIDKVFTRKGLEQNPTLDVTRSLEGTITHKFGQSMDAADENLVQVALADVGRDVSVRGIIVKDFFKDFDRHNTGFVTEQRFLRGLYRFSPNLSDAKVDLLRKRYSDGSDVNYRQFHEDVTVSSDGPADQPAQLSASRSAIARARPVSARALAQLEDRVIRHVFSKRVRLNEFFRDYDRLRKGRCTRPQFKSVLHMSQLRLSEAEMNALADKYGSRAQADCVDYSRFVAYINAAFSRPNLEKDPQSPVAAAYKDAARGDRRGVTLGSPRTEAEVAEVMQRLRAFVAQHRLQLKDMFQDFDRNREQSVTVPQLARVLAVMGITAGGRELNLLARRFRVQSSGVERVNYVLLLEELLARPEGESAATSPTTGFQPLMSSSRGGGGGGKQQESESLDQVLADIKVFVASRRLRSEDFFVDADKHRRGHVTRPQFLAGLSGMVPWLSARSSELVADAYTDNSTRTHGVGNVDWRRFSADIDAIFTVSGLESAPTLDVASATMTALHSTTAVRGGALARVALSPEEEEVLQAVLLRTRAAVENRRILLPPFFADFDSHRLGRLPSSQFLRALAVAFRAGDFSHEELDILSRHYAVVADGDSRTRPSVNYKNFCEDVAAASTELKRSEVQQPFQLQKSRTALAGAVGASVGDTFNSGAPAAVDMEELLRRLRRRASTRRIRVKAFLRDYDRLRHGYVLVPKFRTAVDNAFGITLAPTEMRALTARFASSKAANAVDYMEFAHAVEGGDEQLEKSPRKTLRRRSEHKFTEREADVDQAALDEVLATIAGRVAIGRMHIKAYFQDYDRHNDGSVTKTQFASVLEFSRLLPSPAETELLLKAFELPQARDRMNYVRFCYRVNGSSRPATPL